MRFILASICASLAHLSRFSGLPVSRRPSLECHYCPTPAADLARGLEPFRTDPAWSFRSYHAPRATWWPWDDCLAVTGLLSPAQTTTRRLQRVAGQAIGAGDRDLDHVPSLSRRMF